MEETVEFTPISPDAEEFEEALRVYQQLAHQAVAQRDIADQIYCEAYLHCPPLTDGKMAPEHFRKVHADQLAILAELGARDAEVDAQVARFRVEFLIKRAGRQ